MPPSVVAVGHDFAVDLHIFNDSDTSALMTVKLTSRSARVKRAFATLSGWWLAAIISAPVPCAHWVRRTAAALGVLILLSTATNLWSAVAGDTQTAEVLYVLDGDSLRARLGATAAGEECELRLWGIDAPEKNQPGADLSRQALKTLVHGKTITIHVITVDQFDRLVVQMQVGTTDVTDINLSQIKHGHAWWFRRFAAHATAYQAAETQARSDHVGLWADKQPEAPWAYRDRMAEIDAQDP